ncbi:MAG: hypothetical protein J6A15_09330 [Clostridia bacterium]|nr:hypothetical protein [Clostridia bacterium]
MKKFKFLWCCVFVCMIFISFKKTYASSLFIGGKLERGVSNMNYYVDSSANGYTSLINAAVNNWVDTGYGWNPIYMNPVSSNYATDVDFYARYGDEISEGILARTSCYNINEASVNPSTSNWFFAKIEINVPTISNYSSYVQQGTIAHELGHAFGLDHQNNNVNSIMCQVGNGRVVQTVDQTSHNAINTLYNN